jgi:tRNA (guanine37-N1)-methyltransferase
VESPLRIRRLEWLAGEKRTVTVHKEFGCRYMVDVGQAYFSPRLSSERKRISDLVSPGECVVNFFAGVGCFSIMIAKHGRPRRIYSIDLNPVALRYHAANVSLNRVSGEIDMICGDARTIVASSLHGQADRVLLPLPELAINSLEAARQALRNGVGTVHCYLFVEARRKLEATQATFSKLKPVLGDLVTPRNRARVHVIRSVGPCRYQVCADIMYG